jgi:hypothetical protein
MKKVIQISIDVTKIDKAKLYQGAKGTYLNATLFLNEETDQYGNNGMIVQSVTLQERQAGVKGAILGNAKVNQAPQSTPVPNTPVGHIEESDLPF